MRFQIKSVPERWFWLLVGGLNTVSGLDRILSPHHSRLGIENLSLLLSNLAWVVCALLLFYNHKITHWEMDADGLRQKRLGITTKINWQDITRVVSMWSGSFDLKIEYIRHGFGPRIGRIFTNPEDRDAFLAELRRFAPHAEFTEKSSGNVLSIIS